MIVLWNFENDCTKGTAPLFGPVMTQFINTYMRYPASMS